MADSIMNSLRTSAPSVVNPAVVVSLVSACILRAPVLFIFLPLSFCLLLSLGKGEEDRKREAERLLHEESNCGGEDGIG